MPYKPETPKATTRFNKYGLLLRWPRIWIIILALILVLLTFFIAGAEVGHTVYDVYRSTAFGGFIAFFPLLICAIFVLITAFVPNKTFLRLAVLLCCLMIILCIGLITYDVFVIIDPTQCYFLNCNYAPIYTGTGTVYGWPVSVTWPAYFTINMNVKRLFQSIQMLCSGLYILFASLFIITYVIYRHIRLNQQTNYNGGHNTYAAYDPNRASARRYNATSSPRPATRAVSRNSHNVSQSYSHVNIPHKATIYSIDGHPDTSLYKYHQPPAPVSALVSAPAPAPSPRPTTRAVSRSSHYVSQSYSHFNTPRKVTVYSIEGHPDSSAHRYQPPATSEGGRRTTTPTKAKGRTFVRPRASSLDESRSCTRCNREPRMMLATHYERQNYFSHLCVNCNNELANHHRKTPHPLPRNNRHWIP